MSRKNHFEIEQAPSELLLPSASPSRLVRLKKKVRPLFTVVFKSKRVISRVKNNLIMSTAIGCRNMSGFFFKKSAFRLTECRKALFQTYTLKVFQI